jgi:hypothetical protein
VATSPSSSTSLTPSRPDDLPGMAPRRSSRRYPTRPSFRFAHAHSARAGSCTWPCPSWPSYDRTTSSIPRTPGRPTRRRPAVSPRRTRRPALARRGRRAARDHRGRGHSAMGDYQRGSDVADAFAAVERRAPCGCARTRAGRQALHDRRPTSGKLRVGRDHLQHDDLEARGIQRSIMERALRDASELAEARADIRNLSENAPGRGPARAGHQRADARSLRAESGARPRPGG